MTRKIYRLVAGSDAPRRGQGRAPQQLSEQGVVQSDIGDVATISTQPGSQSITIQYRLDYAEKMGAELEELANDSAIDSVPIFIDGSESPPFEGYYTLKSANVSRADPRTDLFVDVDVTFAFKGKRGSHRRGVRTNTDQESHPFGNDQTALVGVPADATKLRWLDESNGSTEEPSLVATRTAEHGNIEVYDARASSFYDPPEGHATLIYDLPYADQGPTDVRVWDDRGEDSRLDDNDVLQWQKVFVSSHDFEGQAILSNGIVRLLVDEDTQSLTAETWDGGESEWSGVSLGSSDWELFDFDLRRVGLASAHAMVEFRDTTQSPTEYYTLNLWIKRGWGDPLWSEVDGQGGTPSGLEALLDPVASGSNYDPGENLGLVSREDY